MDRAFRGVIRRSMSLAQLRSSPKLTSASEIRKTFLDYFCKEQKHLYIRSSPVFSLKDPTLAFTNAGMNQFKDVFLGLVEPASSRVANSQKCIRIGGTHNDLEQVGKDGSHHTYFEMLGNWSFGDYFKEDACRMAWNLLTQIYNIPAERLYVTYFGGDDALNLSPDLEVREIWRQIGVKESHILVFGAKENFWAGGPTGPCGPCTEIHYDHCEGRTDVGNFVNSGRNDVTELWNLVFTQFDRKASGELINLRKHFVDTGMGLERLVAVLQGKRSNYDTDLFLPLFEVIKTQTGHSGYTGKYDGNATDCGYRMLADHSRMLAVALSDGMIPNHHHKVRGILRKSLSLSQKLFRAKPDLLKELSNHVAEILSDTYPEIGKNLSKIHYIIDNEAETMRINNENALIQWQKMKKAYPMLNDINIKEAPQILTGLEYFSKNVLGQGKRALTGEDVFVLYDTYGVPIHVTEEVALKLGLGFDMAAFLDYERLKKAVDKEHLHKKYVVIRKETPYLDVLSKLEERKIPRTLDYFKYDYRVDGTGKYIFKEQETTIEAILCGNELLDELSVEEIKGFDREKEIGLILDRSHLFAEEGNQASDYGTLIIEKEIIFEVKKLIKIKDYVIHFGTFNKLPSNGKVSVQNLGVLRLDESRRLSIMRNHTGLHLVNAFLREELDITGEKFSVVKPEKLLLEFMVYKKNLHLTEDVRKLEKFVKDFILHGVSVKRKILSLSQFRAMDDVVFIPGENILSREVPIIEINSGFKLSREYCTGTHLLNTSHMDDFVVMKFIKGSNRIQRIEAVTGEKCAQVRKSDAELLEKWLHLKKELSENDQLDLKMFRDLESRIKDLMAEVSASTEISHVARAAIGGEVSDAKKKLNSLHQISIRNFLRDEIQKASKETSESFIVLCLERHWEFNPNDLEVATECFNEKPLLVLLKSKDAVAIQCIVPRKFTSNRFSARNWLTGSAICLGGIAKCKPHQNPDLFFHLRDRNASQGQIDQIMETAVRIAKENF